MKQNLTFLGVLLTTFFMIQSCGGSSGGGDFTSVNGTTAPNLTTAQQNAVATSTSSVAGTGQLAASGATTAYKYAKAEIASLSAAGTTKSKTLPQSQTFPSESFSSGTESCTTSGTRAASGTYSGNYTATESALALDLSITAAVVTNQCQEVDGYIDGTINTTTAVNLNLAISGGNVSSGDITVTSSLSGSITAKGKNDNGDMQTVAMTFNSFQVKLTLTASDYASFGELYDTNASTAANIEFMKNHLQCSGTVTLDGQTLTCAQFLITAINKSQS